MQPCRQQETIRPASEREGTHEDAADAMINNLNRWPPSSSGSGHAKLLSFPVNTNKRAPVSGPHEAASSPRHTPTSTTLRGGKRHLKRRSQAL